MGVTQAEARRLCANVSNAQREWMQRYTFREWPEWFVGNHVSDDFRLDGSDEAPDEEWWWGCIAHWYTEVSGQPAPELACIEPAHSPSGIKLNA